MTDEEKPVEQTVVLPNRAARRMKLTTSVAEIGQQAVYQYRKTRRERAKNKMRRASRQKNR